MDNTVIAAVIVFLLGVVFSAVNYGISKYLLLRHRDKYSYSSVIRLITDAIFIFCVYIYCDKSGCNIIWVFISAALGITLPMLIFTKKLLELNKSLSSTSQGKEEDSHG